MVGHIHGKNRGSAGPLQASLARKHRRVGTPAHYWRGAGGRVTACSERLQTPGGYISMYSPRAASLRSMPFSECARKGIVIVISGRRFSGPPVRGRHSLRNPFPLFGLLRPTHPLAGLGRRFRAADFAGSGQKPRRLVGLLVNQSSGLDCPGLSLCRCPCRPNCRPGPGG